MNTERLAECLREIAADGQRTRELMPEAVDVLREAAAELTRLRRMPVPGQTWRRDSEMREILRVYSHTTTDGELTIWVDYYRDGEVCFTKLPDWLAWSENAEVVDGT